MRTDLYKRCLSLKIVPCGYNLIEPQIMFFFLDQNLCGFQVRIGDSMKNFMKSNPNAEYINKVKEVYSTNNYIIYPSTQTREINVYLRNSATSDSILCAYFHSILYGIIICAINKIDLVSALFKYNKHIFQSQTNYNYVGIQLKKNLN